MSLSRPNIPVWALDIINSNYEKPVFTFRRSALVAAVNYFQAHFPAEILYAVKANPSLHVLHELMRLGINKFDVASLDEVKLVYNQLPSAQLYFMNPVKSRHAIGCAYFDYGVRHFSLDTEDELNKILDETNNARDLVLHVRLSIPNIYAEMSLDGKFGIDTHDAPQLLNACAKVGSSVGVCFHVGSQCMHPSAYSLAIEMAQTVISKSNASIGYFNIGGGFPSVYPGMHPPALIQYFDKIHHLFRQLPNSNKMQLLSEPGRALVAESGSLIVNVILRKGNRLYIDSGTYGAMFDAGTPEFIFPTRLLRADSVGHAGETQAFHFYGPTCDSLDYMPGPFYLPADIREGDFIEIGQLGAYSCSLASRFNGFTHKDSVVEIDDAPLMSLYPS